jgi:preprotein translocase subunit SecA
MFNSILTKIVGSKNERDLKKMRPTVERINELEPEFVRMSSSLR